MTTSDPPSRNYPVITGGRELTESLDLDRREPAVHAALAVGTHQRESTRVEAPNARARTRPPMRHDSPPDDQLGQVLGAYRLLELLGKGGMGYVFRAEHVKLGRQVALKLLRSDYASRRDAVMRFFQEARTVNRIRHRNIVEVTDFVELDDGTTFIIMELLTGASLGAWARSGVDQARALAVLVQICDGLSEAHQVGVVHRDLKPDNVIIVPTSDGAELVKLLDFGVAKLLNRDDEIVGLETAAGSVIGTPAYMSPEQAGGMEIDARSDIYSLGAIMYELFCGTPVFRGRSFGEYVRRHLTELPVPPRQTAGGANLAPELEALILRCLDKDPARRFPTALELRESLFQLLGTCARIEGAPGHGAGLTLQLPSRGAPAASPATRHTNAPDSSPLGRPGSQLPSVLPTWMLAPEPPTSANQRRVPPERPPGPYAIRPPAPKDEKSARGPLSALRPAPGRAVVLRWLPWLAGGVVAVAAGASAASWYRKYYPSPPRVAPSPAAEPAIAPARAPRPAEPGPPASAGSAQASAAPEPALPIDRRPRLFEVRFESAPSGSVFAAGLPGELCTTPCAFKLDLADGGAVDRRDFVVRRDGYLDSLVTVDLAAPQHDYFVSLQPSPRAASEPADPIRPIKRRPRSGQSGSDKPHRTDHRSPLRPPRSVAPQPRALDPVPTPEPPAAVNPEPPAVVTPTPTALPPSKPAAIDPADTLDPFHHKVP
jgi:eukaryotic-like serine/threonine-protein kinase